MESQRGSALLITMIVITVVGTIAFSIGASTISSFRQQTQLEDSANAYQAAVAGLEDGLLRWRFNKDTETPVDRTEKDCDANRPTTSTQFYDRVNLSTGEVTYCIDPNDVSSPDPTQIVYDIKIHYKKDPGEPEIVDSQPTPSGIVPALAKDNAVEYDVSELPVLGGGIVDLGWIFENFSPFDATQRVEAFSLSSDGNVIENSRKLFETSQTASLRFGGTLSFNTLGGTKIRIRPFGEDLKQYKIKTSSNQIALDSRTSRIEVTGYFGQSKRKLQLALDRSSGSILPLYDFVLFSSGSGLGS